MPFVVPSTLTPAIHPELHPTQSTIADEMLVTHASGNGIPCCQACNPTVRAVISCGSVCVSFIHCIKAMMASVNVLVALAWVHPMMWVLSLTGIPHLGHSTDKNHMGIGNHHVSSLGFVLILWDLIHGTKNRQSTLTKTDPFNTSHFHHDIIHQVQCFIHPISAHTFNNAGPHHPQGPHHHLELFKRSPVGFWLKSTGNQSRSWVQD